MLIVGFITYFDDRPKNGFNLAPLAIGALFGPPFLISTPIAIFKFSKKKKKRKIILDAYNSSQVSSQYKNRVGENFNLKFGLGLGSIGVFVNF